MVNVDSKELSSSNAG